MRERPPLAVRTKRLGPAFDLLAAYGGREHFYFERAGTGVATSWEHGGTDLTTGPADPKELRILAEGAIEDLRSLAYEGDGPGPVAVGALPFDATGRASLTVSGRTVVRLQEGETWLVDLVPGDREPEPFESERVVAGAPHDAFEVMQLRATPEPEGYVHAVSTAVQRIQVGELRKVVLARFLEVEAGRELDPRQLAARLRAVDPDCFVFAAPVGHELPRPTLVGASPELLVARHGREVTARPLAGSAPRFGDPKADETSRSSLLSSAKDRVSSVVWAK